MKAYELIDSPEKWWDGECYGQYNPNRHCAATAIWEAYGDKEVNQMNRLCRYLGLPAVQRSVFYWNDSSDQPTVYNTLKELDI